MAMSPRVCSSSAEDCRSTGPLTAQNQVKPVAVTGDRHWCRSGRGVLSPFGGERQSIQLEQGHLRMHPITAPCLPRAWG